LNNIEFFKEKSMKRLNVLLGIVITTTVLMAGGNTASTLSKVSNVPAKACNDDAIYVEKDVNLMWQDQKYTESENGAFKREGSIGKSGNHRYAAAYCSRLLYAGYGDWRLPTSDELVHVHQKEDQVFNYFRDNDFWSSTPTTEGRYYVVFPADSLRYPRSPKQSNFVRCVRCINEN